MRKSKYTEEQIVAALKLAESGGSVDEILHSQINIMIPWSPAAAAVGQDAVGELSVRRADLSHAAARRELHAADLCDASLATPGRREREAVEGNSSPSSAGTTAAQVP